ncbi:MAG: HxsD-like protein [Candidatus Paceibacterota bacterium]
MEIRANKKIYKRKGIKKTIEAYNHLGKIDLSENKNYFIVSAKNIDKEIEEIFKDEFCNYLLFETSKCP